MTATDHLFEVELAEPEAGAPRYSGRDRQELEARLVPRGLLNASLRNGELVILVAAPLDWTEPQVTGLVAGAASRAPGVVRLREVQL